VWRTQFEILLNEQRQLDATLDLIYPSPVEALHAVQLGALPTSDSEFSCARDRG
jgi:hypothetical protein